MNGRIRRSAVRWLVGGFFAVVVVAALLGIVGARSGGEGKEVPKIEISLNDVTLDEINENGKWVKYYGNGLTLDIDGERYEFKDVEIKGRGNASWAMDKKSYRIKFANKVNLFGLGKMKKWGLISNWIDDSLLRNDLAQYVAGLLNENYPIRGEFVELTIDEEWLGLYYLVNLMSIGKKSVDLRDGMGVLVELDNVYCESDKVRERSEIFRDCIVVEDVVMDENVDDALSFFMDDYTEFEKAVLEGNFEWASGVVDMKSWAKYYLLSEFTSNPDAYLTSWYLYKDGAEDKIHAGLGWDFDAAFGNRNWGEWPEGFYSPTETMARMKYVFGEKENFMMDGGECGYKMDEQELPISPTMCYLIDMPDFRDLVRDIYREELMNRREDVIEYIRFRTDYIRETALKDDEKWGGDFDGEVEYLVWWVEERFEFFDEIYGIGGLKPEVRPKEI